MSAITAKASRKMKKYAVLTREPRCFLGSFDFSWEQRKLGDMMNVTSVKRIHQSDWTDSGVRFLRARDIVAAAKNEEPDDYLYISKEKYEEYSALSGKVGVSDLLVTGVGTIGVPYLVRNLEPLYFKDGNIIWFQNSDKIDGKFLFYSFSAEQIQGFINESAGIGTVGTYTIESGKKTPISLPNQIEQAKVGEFFQQLDNLITLHQRKCALLFSPFQALISMMFTTSTFSWEQRKLSEMCGTFEYGLNAAAKEFDGKNKYIRITDIDDASREFLLSDLSSPDICLDGMSKYLLSSGDIVFARTGASVGKTYIYRENDGIVYFAGFLIRAKVNQDNDAEFVFQSTLSPSYEKYIRITSQRSGQPGVNAQEYSEYDLFAPSKEEQQRIGHFLRGIDNLITLHQRKCISFTGRAGRLISTVNKKRITSSWEQRKVSELFRVTRGYVLAATQTETTKTDEKPYPVYSSQTKDKGLMGYYKDYLYEDAITWTTDGANAGTVNYRAGKFYCTNVCGVLLSNEVKANQMIAEALNSVAKGYVSYVGNPKLMNNVMADIVIQIPTQAEEREQLSSIFAKLDNLITLHQRKPFLMKWRTSDANRNQTNRLVL